MSAENEPARLIARFKPIAKARLRPVKYCAIAASVEMLKVSAPMPNSSRPAAIPAKPGLKAVSAAPARHTAVVQSITRAAPKRSTSTPPSRTSTTFGRL